MANAGGILTSSSKSAQPLQLSCDGKVQVLRAKAETEVTESDATEETERHVNGDRELDRDVQVQGDDIWV